MLGEVCGIENIGEFQYISSRSIRKEELCGCNKTLPTCSFWAPILETVKSQIEDDKLTQAFSYLNKLEKVKSLFQLSLVNNEGIKQAQKMVAFFYQTIKASTDCKVIVDSSKTPSYGWFLKNIPNTEIYVLHLIRDSRAVVNSMIGAKPKPDSKNPDAKMESNTLLFSIRTWVLHNLLSELLKFRFSHYLRLTYEDLIRDPEQTMNKIFRFVEERELLQPFCSDGSVVLSAQHTISGNPDRFKLGKILLNEDLKWKKNLTIIQKFIVTFLTLPFLLYYRNIKMLTK